MSVGCWLVGMRPCGAVGCCVVLCLGWEMTAAVYTILAFLFLFSSSVFVNRFCLNLWVLLRFKFLPSSLLWQWGEGCVVQAASGLHQKTTTTHSFALKKQTSTHKIVYCHCWVFSLSEECFYPIFFSHYCVSLQMYLLVKKQACVQKKELIGFRVFAQVFGIFILFLIKIYWLVNWKY